MSHSGRRATIGWAVTCAFIGLGMALWAQGTDAPPATPPAPPVPSTPDEIVRADIPMLIGRLTDKDPFVVDEARWDLLGIGRPGVLELVKRLSDNNPDQQFKICEILGELRDPVAVQPLLEQLKNRSAKGSASTVATAAAMALGKLADRSAAPALMDALDSGDSDLKYSAAVALGNLRAVEAVPKLKEALKDKATTFYQLFVRAAAADALGKLRATGCEKELSALFDEIETEPSTEQPVGYYAARALERITGQTQGSLTESSNVRAESLAKWKKWAQDKHYIAPPPEPPKEPGKEGTPGATPPGEAPKETPKDAPKEGTAPPAEAPK